MSVKCDDAFCFIYHVVHAVFLRHVGYKREQYETELKRTAS